MPRQVDSSDLLRRAFQMLKADMSKPENSQIEPTAHRVLQDLHLQLDKWAPSEDTSIFDHYWTSAEANAVSSEGLATMNKKNLAIFLQEDSAAAKLRLLFQLRKNEAMDYRLIGKISEVGLIDHLESYPLEKGNKPMFYVQRMEIMLFPELFTSIADRKKLEDTGLILGIKGSKGLSFEALQYQIRDKANDFIKDDGLEGETDYVKRSIAWWVIEAYRELKDV